MKRRFLECFVTHRGEWPKGDRRGPYYAFAVPRVPAIWTRSSGWVLL